MSQRPCKILLKPSARDDIARDAANRHPMEAGGVLLGYREDNTIVVTHALPVPSPDEGLNRYTRDDVLANELLVTFLANREPDDPTGYIGEWHSHPAPSRPSPLDVHSLRAIARRSEGPIALIVHSPDTTRPFTGVVARHQHLGRVTVRDVIVTVQSRRAPVLGPLPEGAVRGDGPVFISYRQSDGSERADSLEGLLRAAGLVVWRDHTDLRAGTTTDRLEQALTIGLSGAVLVVTPEIAQSTIVKQRELPRLIELDEDPRFGLCIANEVPNSNDASRPDYSAPDRLLGLAPTRTLGDKKQSTSRDLAGRLEIVRDLLLHRIEQIKPFVAESGVLTISTQTRPVPSALDAGNADLQIRLQASAHGRLPSQQGLIDLQAVLPHTSDAIHAANAPTVRLVGGMHLSVAVALGAALPETKIGHIEVVDLGGAVWSSSPGDDEPQTHRVEVTPVDVAASSEIAGPAQVAVFVTLTENADPTAFKSLVNEQAGQLHAAQIVALTPDSPVDHREGARLSRTIANQLKRIAAEFGRADIHLAFHGPVTMAVLIGRLLNTLRVTVYEWDNPASGPRYTPVMTLEPGVTGGPITKLYRSGRYLAP